MFQNLGIALGAGVDETHRLMEEARRDAAEKRAVEEFGWKREETADKLDRMRRINDINKKYAALYADPSTGASALLQRYNGQQGDYADGRTAAIQSVPGGHMATFFDGDGNRVGQQAYSNQALRGELNRLHMAELAGVDPSFLQHSVASGQKDQELATQRFKVDSDDRFHNQTWANAQKDHNATTLQAARISAGPGWANAGLHRDEFNQRMQDRDSVRELATKAAALQQYVQYAVENPNDKAAQVMGAAAQSQLVGVRRQYEMLQGLQWPNDPSGGKAQQGLSYADIAKRNELIAEEEGRLKVDLKGKNFSPEQIRGLAAQRVDALTSGLSATGAPRGGVPAVGGAQLQHSYMPEGAQRPAAEGLRRVPSSSGVGYDVVDPVYGRMPAKDWEAKRGQLQGLQWTDVPLAR